MAAAGVLKTTPMFDHVVVCVRDLARSVAFYRATLKPLGLANAVRYEGHEGHAALEGFGDARETYLLLKKGKPAPKALHFAFAADSKKVVNAFYKAALGSGGQDNGPPGARAQYFPGYYAAYVLDPDGYNVEAVHQKR